MANKIIFNGGVLVRSAPGDNGGDNDTGLYSNARSWLSVYTNCAERVRAPTAVCKFFGVLMANTKNFKIDHPLDPLNKNMTYTSVESPDVINIYNGNVTKNEKAKR